MTHDDWNHHNRSTDGVTHSKEDALDEREFEQFWEGSQRMDDYFGMEARLIAMLAGRLGLRAGEIAHLKEDWINWRDKRIEVPAHQTCEKGKDGGMCGNCRQQVEQCVDHNDDVRYEDVVDNWWRPKTEAAVRGVPWDWSPRAELVIERFFDRFDGFDRSYTAISRRVKRAAEHAPHLKPEDIYPHCLRASSATYLASRGLGPHALCSMLGWCNLSTAQVYIARSDRNTQRAVRSIHSQ